MTGLNSAAQCGVSRARTAPGGIAFWLFKLLVPNNQRKKRTSRVMSESETLAELKVLRLNPRSEVRDK